MKEKQEIRRIEIGIIQLVVVVFAAMVASKIPYTEITQGSIYHVIYYGRNAMGSYASQITEKERWQVALYVEQLRNKLINK